MLWLYTFAFMLAPAPDTRVSSLLTDLSNDLDPRSEESTSSRTRARTHTLLSALAERRTQEVWQTELLYLLPLHTHIYTGLAANHTVWHKAWLGTASTTPSTWLTSATICSYQLWCYEAYCHAATAEGMGSTSWPLPAPVQEWEQQIMSNILFQEIEE